MESALVVVVGKPSFKNEAPGLYYSLEAELVIYRALTVLRPGVYMLRKQTIIVR